MHVYACIKAPLSVKEILLLVFITTSILTAIFIILQEN